MAKREIYIYSFIYKRKTYTQVGKNLFWNKKSNELIKIEDKEFIDEMIKYFNENPDKIKIKLI